MGRVCPGLPVCLLVPGKGPRPEEKLQFWTLKALPTQESNRPQVSRWLSSAPAGPGAPIASPLARGWGPGLTYCCSHLRLHLTTSSIYSIKCHTHTHRLGVRERAGVILRRGVASSPPRGPQNTHTGVLSASGKGALKDRGKQRITASKTYLPSSFIL